MPVTLEAALDFQKQLAANRLVLNKNQLKKQRRRMKELFQEAAAATSEDADPSRKRRCRPGKRGREAAAAKSKQQSSTEQPHSHADCRNADHANADHANADQANADHVHTDLANADRANADRQSKRRKKKRCKEPAASQAEEEAAADVTGVKTVHAVERVNVCAEGKQLVEKKGKKRQRVLDGLPVDASCTAAVNVQSAPGDDAGVIGNKHARKKARNEGKRVRLPSVESGSDYCRKTQACESDHAGTDAVNGTVNDAVNGADAVNDAVNGAGTVNGSVNGAGAVNATGDGAVAVNATVNEKVNGTIKAAQPGQQPARAAAAVSNGLNTGNPQSVSLRKVLSLVPRSCQVASKPAPKSSASSAAAVTRASNTSTATTTAAHAATSANNAAAAGADIVSAVASVAASSNAASAGANIVSSATAAAAAVATVHAATRAAVSAKQAASTAPTSSSLASAWTTEISIHQQIIRQHPNTTTSTVTVEAGVASTTNCSSKSSGLADSAAACTTAGPNTEAGGRAVVTVKRLKKSRGRQQGGGGGDAEADGACDRSDVRDRAGACDGSEGQAVVSTAGQAERACDVSEGQVVGSTARQVAGAGGADPGLSRKKLRPQYLYGNYHRYYGKRLAGDLDHDPRIKAIKGYASWLRDKRCIDVGCNEGILTLQLATQFNCQSMLGVDIDAGLVSKACRHLSELRHKCCEQMDRQQLTGLNCGGRPFAELRAAAKALSATVFAHEEWVHTPARKNSADVVFCFSVTKWVQLHFGDEGVKALFAKVAKVLSPGGVFVLEPQPWSSYENSRRKPGMLSVTYCKGMQLLELRPEQFVDYLTTKLNMKLLKEVQVESEGGAKQGFGRTIYILQKSDAPGKV